MTPAPEQKPVPALALPDRRRRIRRRRLAISAFVLGLVGIAFVLLRPRPVTDDGIRTETLERRTVRRMVTLTGHVDVLERVDVPAPIGGSLLAIEVAPGDRVTVGQPLARLDPRRSALALSAARATLQASTSRVASARAAVDSARDQLARAQRLATSELSSQADLDAARYAVQRAESELAAARAEQSTAASGVGTAELGAESGLLRSPIDGVVLQAPARLGTLVGPELGAIFVIGSGLDPLRIAASAGEADIGDLRVGQASWFEVAAYPDRRFSADLSRIELDATILPGSVTFPVQFRVANPEGLLRPGMTAIVHVEVARADSALSVHEAALRFEPVGAEPAPARSRVWLRTGMGRLEPIPVVPGVSDGAITEIRPVDPRALRVGAPIAIGMRVEGGGVPEGLSLGSTRRRAEP